LSFELPEGEAEVGIQNVCKSSGTPERALAVAETRQFGTPKESLAGRRRGCGRWQPAEKCVALFCEKFAKQALFTAEVTPAMPAIMTRADAGWGRLQVAVPVANLPCCDIKAVCYCPAFIQVDDHFIVDCVTSNTRP
jgi:hypothetical protein